MIIFVLVFLPHHMVYGSTCIGDKEARMERSKSYLSQVRFEPYIDGSEIDVVLSFPTQIDGVNFSGISLAQESHGIGETQFIFPLEAKLENGRVQTGYMLSKEMAEDNIIQAVYGDSCGLLIQYRLDYEQKKLKPD